MEKTKAKRWGKLGGGLVASILLHLVAFAVLFVEMPEPMSQPEPEESVAVEIVPPPEQKEPEQAKAEELAEPKQEPAAAPPPPSSPQPPPPESVPTPPERPAEQPPIDEVGGEEAAGEDPPPPMPVLRPVIQFGEKDAGPRQDTSGDAAEEAAKPVEAPPEESEPPTEEPQSTPPEEDKTAEADEPEGTPLPDDIALPKVDTGQDGAEADGARPAEKPGETTIAFARPTSPLKKPEPPAAEPKAAEKPTTEATPAKVELDEVKTLYSTSLSGDAAAMTAMSDVPRPDRADQLCVTELREQLRHGTPAYRPELLPSFRLQDGNVLAVDKAAFRAAGQWFDLRFRCEIDTDATRVLSFAFEVGRSIPKSEWKRYGFPDF